MWIPLSIAYSQFSSDSCAIRDTVSFIFAFIIRCSSRVWHSVGSDGCFLTGWDERRKEQMTSTQICQFMERRPDRALRPHTGPHGVSCWLCTCVFLEQVGDKLCEPILSSSRCTSGLPSAPSWKFPKVPKWCALWVDPGDKTSGPVNLGAKPFPPPTLSPLCPNRNLLERKCGRRNLCSTDAHLDTLNITS